MIGDIRVHWRESGSGDAVLFIHGFPFDGGMWTEQLERLPERWRLLAPDLRGYGGTTRGDAAPSMDRFADDLALLLDHLGVESAAVCGLSMGGYVAFSFWRRHPERVDALVLSDTRAGTDNEAARRGRHELAARVRSDGSAAAADALLPKLFSERTRRERPQVVEFIRDTIESTDAETIALTLEALAERPDSTALLAAIVVPKLVVVGAEDALTGPDEAQRLAEGIADARLVTISDAGHLPPLEAPVEFNRALVHFLEAVQGH